MIYSIPADRSVSGEFKIRTRSPRRYLVVDTKGRYVIKRTDNLKTAEATAWRGGHATIVVDTRAAQ